MTCAGLRAHARANESAVERPKGGKTLQTKTKREKKKINFLMDSSR